MLLIVSLVRQTVSTPPSSVTAAVSESETLVQGDTGGQTVFPGRVTGRRTRPFTSREIIVLEIRCGEAGSSSTTAIGEESP
jgi:hypothetical protein